MSASVSDMILVPISPGELIDRITILDIKRTRIADVARSANVAFELALLRAVRDRAVSRSTEIARLAAELFAVNEMLWELEDAVRDCERRKHFGPTFIRAARGIYRGNDRRALLKRRINEVCRSVLVEEKSYAAYD
jgi:hypothetical protein